MKKQLPLLLILFFQLSFHDLFAQLPTTNKSNAHDYTESPDSVWVEGQVTIGSYSDEGRRADSNAVVQLLQVGEIIAVASCKSDGFFTIGWIPSGIYTLSVASENKSLYYSEVQLSQSAMFNIVLMPDTAKLRTLRPAEVVASRILPVYQSIKSPDDPRLWNLNGNPILYDSRPACASNAGGPRVGFFNPLSLASWRPRWLDAPFHKKKKHNNK